MASYRLNIQMGDGSADLVEDAQNVVWLSHATLWSRHMDDAAMRALADQNKQWRVIHPLGVCHVVVSRSMACVKHLRDIEIGCPLFPHLVSAISYGTPRDCQTKQ